MQQRCAMTVTEERSDRVARLSGDLDAASAPSVREGLQRLCGRETGRLVIDLSGVSILDGQGARLLANLSHGAYGAGARIRLRAPSHHLQAVIAAAATIPFWAA